ncbi:hypothetical protein KAR91_65740 [Candidatus Pacearchaeota archaeon]|nr:hypothetical protein [Candidatus Pacearchaeota archaeon]
MANEAKCIETPSRFARYTIAAGSVLPIGTIMVLTTDPHTIVASSAADQGFAGIVWEVASTSTSTFTEITVALDGVWDIKDAGAGSTIATLVAVGGANLSVTADAADILNGAIMGYVEETTGAAEVVRTRLTKFGSSGEL